MEALNFKNFSTEDFTHTFDGVPYTFKAGQEIFLEDYKAYHFAKHLVDREMNKLGILTNNAHERERLGKLCFASAETVTPMEALNIEEKKKVGRKSKKVEAEFADLEDKN